MKVLSLFTAIMVLFTHMLTLKGEIPFSQLPIEERAILAGMEDDVDTFIFISSVVEAESDRSTPSEGELTTEGRVMIAIVILNRVSSDRFRNQNTIYDVLTASGQFSTVVYRNGHYQSVTDRTDYSDYAVIEAVRRVEAGDAPEVLFFNCRGYASEPYAYIGGNYFSL